MRFIALLVTLAAPLRAQTAALPSAPAPTEALQANAEKLDDLFRRFTSGRPMIPTLKEVQAQQLKRDLMPRPGDSAPSADANSRFTIGAVRPLTRERRELRESVDVAFSRPVSRVELGVGRAEDTVLEGPVRVSHRIDKYLFLRVDLSRAPLPRKLLHSPTAIRTESEVGLRTRVESDEYSIRSLPRP